jgi:hypothetical protein
MSGMKTLLALVAAIVLTTWTIGCSQPAPQTAQQDQQPQAEPSETPADTPAKTTGATEQDADADKGTDPEPAAPADDDTKGPERDATAKPGGDGDPAPTGNDGAPTAAVAEEDTDSVTKEWPQWGGDSHRNNTPVGKGIPHHWKPGKFAGNPAEWQPATAENVKWVARLGSQSYGNATLAGGKIYVGTNNRAGWLERYPPEKDLGCLIAFDIKDGKFLWQHSSEKLKTGRVHDWPLQGICCAPLIEGERLWFVTSRGEVRCLDTEGFLDGENDGPYTDETNENKDEADVIWVFNMMDELGVSQHNMCSCSVTASGDILFVNTSNGVDESHILLPSPDAPFPRFEHSARTMVLANVRRAGRRAASAVCGWRRLVV